MATKKNYNEGSTTVRVPNEILSEVKRICREYRAVAAKQKREAKLSEKTKSRLEWALERKQAWENEINSLTGENHGNAS